MHQPFSGYRAGALSKGADVNKATILNYFLLSAIFSTCSGVFFWYVTQRPDVAIVVAILKFLITFSAFLLVRQ
jgi:uncharacterized membrane protein